MPSRARTYFDELKTLGGEGIAALINAEEPRFEGDWLEYKSGNDLNAYLAALDDDSDITVGLRKGIKDKLKDAWAECLSAFANNEGGVIVWGIHAVTRNRIDAPCDIKPVTDLKRAQSALISLADKMSDPPIAGLEYATLQHGGPNEGFLLAYIPEGKFKPYKAEGTLKRFYLRTGSSSYVPTVAVLRMLFTTAKRYTAKLTCDLQQSSHSIFQCDVWIKNTSLYTIRNPFLTVTLHDSPNFRFYQQQAGEVQVRGGALRFKPAASLNNRDSLHVPLILSNLSGKGNLTVVVTLTIEDSYPLVCFVDLDTEDKHHVEASMFLHDIDAT